MKSHLLDRPAERPQRLVVVGAEHMAFPIPRREPSSDTCKPVLAKLR